MADKKISELPDATLPIAAGVKFEAVQGGVNVKVDAGDMPGSSGTSIPFGSTSGTNTYTIAATPAVTAYTNGMLLQMRVVNSSTGLVTLNFDGVGAKKLIDTDGTQATDGYLKAGVDYLLSYNSALDGGAGAFTVVNEIQHGVMNLRGVYAASGGLYPGSGGSGPSGAIRHGDTWVVSGTDTIGSLTLRAGDLLTTPVDAPGQTASNWYWYPGKTTIDLKANYLTTYRRETASYTLDATDLATINSGARLVIEMNVGSANNLTIPPNATVAFPIGTKFWVKQYGAGQTSFVAGAGVDLRASAGVLNIGSQYGTAIFEKIATNEWYIENGDPSVLQSTYTPTLNNTTNVAASTAYVTGYFRIGNSVTVFGKVSIDTTAAASTATLLGMSLPIASNLAAEEDLAGTAVCGSTAQSVRIMADATNDRASFSFLALATTNDNYSFTFSYLIK